MRPPAADDLRSPPRRGRANRVAGPPQALYLYHSSNSAGPAMMMCASGASLVVSWQMRDWKQYTIDGVVSLAIPDGTTARLEDDDTMIVLTLPGEPSTDILMGLFPLEGDRTVSQDVVQDRLLVFMERCVQGVTRANRLSVERAVDVDDPNLCVSQAVAEIEGDDRWWLARLYGRAGGTDVLLAHWNGPAEQMKRVVLKSLVSITPLFALDGGAAAS
jgi:hypothetical protein